MNNRERGFIAVILCGIMVMVGIDLATDYREGIQWWHFAVEGAMAIAAIAGIFLLVRGSFALKLSLESERRNSSELRVEAEKWRAQSKKFLAGLSHAIDQQLTDWNLTSSEKEVAFLLLKGLSLKEIADVRKTAEKTARAQFIAVYSKSGLAGRSELAAFFLEDLLLPSDQDAESDFKSKNLFSGQ